MHPDARTRCSYTCTKGASAYCSVQSHTDPFECIQNYEQLNCILKGLFWEFFSIFLV